MRRDVLGTTTKRIVEMMRPCSDRGIFGFLATAILIALAVTLAVALPGVSADGGEDGNKDLAIPEKAELKYPNLGSSLDQLVTRFEEGEAPAAPSAGNAPALRAESVAVTIYLSGNVDDVVSFLEDNGGDPRNVGEDYIEAYVPVKLLGPVSEQPGVIRVREIVPPQPAYGDVTSQGVGAHLATAWHEAGITGEGVKVGIIDIGFKGFSGLMGTELPATVQARCYTDIGVHTRNISDCENDDVHGTAAAESLLDIAPDVSLYIANSTGSGIDFMDTVNWMISKDVSVINRSLGGVFHGPGDGTSPSFIYDDLDNINLAVEGGIIFLNAAGNDALVTWFHNSSPSIQNPDRNGHGFIEFAGGDVTNSVGFHDFISPGQQLSEGHQIWTYLRWEDTWPTPSADLNTWLGASTDLDLYLVDSTSGEVIEKSEDYQSGGPGDIPIESIYTEIPRDGQYHIEVVYRGTNLPGWVQLVAPKAYLLEHHTEGYSINGPSESANRGMLAVGAAHYYDTQTIADYSSRGPTPDGRVKPDVVGTACGETASYEPHLRDGNDCWFPGTSQASPHVAGMAALVRQQFPGYTPAQVAAYLKNHAQQRETRDPNNTWGHGFAQLPSPDRAHLVALYHATGGANWTNNTNWLTNAPIGQWHGVTTDSQGRVTELNLTSNQLKGEIPPELAGLTNLGLLALGGNELTGTIPTWLGSLANLEELYLWGNELTGEIPSELGNLVNLVELHLADNQLTGEVPVELGNLTNLKVLALGGNELTGTIPTWLASLANLEELYLWGNELTGEIPLELSNLANMVELHLADNQLTGEIPVELGTLANLTSLSVSQNQLTGAIPTELGSLVKLKELSLSDNQLTGEIPVELGSLSNLVKLVLWGNELTGEIPVELGTLANLTSLSLPQNQLTGAIPSELGSLANLEELYLWENELTGTIPTELGSLANLEELSLSDNQLTGEIPVELGSLSNLEELYLWGNELTGEIPAELGSLSNLEELYLWGNELTGTIPTELGSLANLEVLSLSDNQLSGVVPQTLAELTMLESFSFYNNLGLCAPVDDAFQTWLRGISIVYGSSCALADSPEDRAVLVQIHSATDGANWKNNANWLSGDLTREWYGVTIDANGRVHGLFLGDNQLAGEIPTELGSLTELEWAFLSQNQLTGEIPSELGSLVNLRLLSLRDNQLTGGIPAELGNLANLEQLRLFNNQLTGEIPAELGRLTNLTVLYLSGNQLTGCVPASLQDVADNDFAQLGLPFCPSYDANGDGAIDIGELFSAIDDYFDGRIGISELFTIIDLYFSGPTPTATAQPPGAPTGLTAMANGPGNQEWPGVRPGNHAEHSAP